LKCYDRAIESDPTNYKAFNNKGIVFRNLNKFKEAIECYDQAIKLNPNYKLAINNRNYALKKMENCNIS
jgi:tetratricopeptide (TPR) repeat protein